MVNLFIFQFLDFRSVLDMDAFYLQNKDKIEFSILNQIVAICFELEYSKQKF
jgi:hypothetical protein